MNRSGNKAYKQKSEHERNNGKTEATDGERRHTKKIRQKSYDKSDTTF